jgi:hypothetical protein
MHISPVYAGLAVALIARSGGLVAAAPAEDRAAVYARFTQPPRQYASAPLWVWNDRLTEEQIRSTLDDLADQHVRQAFVHPRPGLMTPYLGDEWFHLWKVALDEAAKRDMNIWIYDENSYPSGFAGGWVPELMPESRGMGLHVRTGDQPPAWRDELLAVYRLEGDRATDVSAALKAGKTLPAGRYVVAEIRRAGNSPWHGGRCYVNLLTRGVTEEFLRVTHEAYRREIGDQFGKRVLGSFTDEPQIRPAGGLPWCPDLPERFEERWGYSLLKHLPGLTLEVGDWRRVRHNYFTVLNELFVERWAKPYHDWCEAHGLAFTGHYWDHEWPNCVGVPDNMAMAAWQQMPGIDCLMNQYAEHTHAQFGNLRFVRELASVANQMGRERRLCEIYGAGGWDLRFVDMKRIADWLGVLGVNFFDQHLSYITIRGARKRDHPQSFSYHEPWWPDYHVMADYLTRLSVALSAGEQVNHILVLEPTTTAWMYQGNGAKLKEIGDDFFALLKALEAAQVEYDLVSEDVLARFGGVAKQNGRVTGLRVGRREYPVFVLPAGAETLDRRTVELLSAARTGLTVWHLGDPPRRVDGAPASAGRDLAAHWRAADRAALVQTLADRMRRQAVRVEPAADQRGILFHQRRQLPDGDLLLLVNTSLEAPARGEVTTVGKGIEQWDLFTGERRAYPSRPDGVRLTASFELPPAGSLLLFLAKQPLTSPPAVEAGEPVSLAATSPLEIRRLAPNVLTLDYVDVVVGSESRESVYFYDANRLIWRQHGFARNPWDSAVQFKDELISRTFPPDSGFTARYRFTIEGVVPADLTLVIERPDLYTITCNGRPVRARPGDWWLDKAFGRIAIADVARVGENIVTLRARPFTMYHELEPAYVRGDFALRPTDRGFVIVPPRPLKIATTESPRVHGVNPDGTMWLSGGIGYTRDALGQPLEDRAPFVEFDLGRAVDLSGARVWNYCESHVRDLTARGVKELRIEVIPEGSARPEPVGADFTLARAAGRARPETLRFTAPRARRVLLRIRANQNGVRYPVAGDAPDNGFVGLAEVEFLDADGHPVKGVRVHRVSGELAALRRTADHLLDGSGLETTRAGWRAQGLPFYADAVAYRQTFDVPEKTGRYVVRLPDWNGSVARVRVNGALAGRIVCPPWECDVTEPLHPGTNTVTVEVVGTLKNTLGPHHGNPPLGAAWPGSFQRGPNPGPPPGARYSTVAYGLFAPFVLERRSGK